MASLRGSIHKKISMTKTRKMWPFNTGDCLIEVNISMTRQEKGDFLIQVTA